MNTNPVHSGLHTVHIANIAKREMPMVSGCTVHKCKFKCTGGEHIPHIASARGVSTYKCTGSLRLLQLDGSAP